MNISFLQLASCPMTNPVNLLVSTSPISCWDLFSHCPVGLHGGENRASDSLHIYTPEGGIILPLLCAPSRTTKAVTLRAIV